MIKFYYGISGTFKSTTINHENDEDCSVVWSMIKYWKYLQSEIFNVPNSHLNFSMLHLCNLKSALDSTQRSKDVFVERGVSDSLYYWSRDRGKEDHEIIESAISEELEICGEEEIEKVLMIMKDRTFIRDVILKEPSRKEVFPLGVSEYLENQDNYINFTWKYNKITRTVEITDAMKYLKDLGIKYIIK